MIVEVAPGLAPDGEREVDARGALVTPGLIDSHTHYDIEMFWDPSLDPLPVYGVTTIVMGNCGLGIAPDKNTPITWSADKNIPWKTEMPGPGASSPIVIGTKIFITCYTGYGVDRDDPGDQKNLKRHLLCVDRTNGNLYAVTAK